MIQSRRPENEERKSEDYIVTFKPQKGEKTSEICLKSLKHPGTSLSLSNVEMWLQSYVATTTLQKGGEKRIGNEIFQSVSRFLSETIVIKRFLLSNLQGRRPFMPPTRITKKQHTKFHIIKQIMDVFCTVTINVDNVHHELKLFHVRNSLNHEFTGIFDVCHQHHFKAI